MEKGRSKKKIYNKILLLRYSDFHGVDTIKEHKEAIEEYGFCWWAKIGKQPREIYLEDFLKQDYAQILLYTQGLLFSCECTGVLFQRPDKGYPEYYRRDIFGTEKEPQVFFKLSSLEKIDLSFLENYIVASSEKEVLHDLKNSISSYMFIQHKDAPRKPKPKKREKVVKKIELSEEEKRSCIYRVNGMCENKGSVNYLFECYRPEICIKQKIKKRNS